MILRADTAAQLRSAYLRACRAAGAEPQRGKATLSPGVTGDVTIIWRGETYTMLIDGAPAVEPRRR